MTQLDGENGVELTRSREVHDSAGNGARHALLHGGGRHADQPRGAEADHRRNAALARAVDFDGEPAAAERQGLCAGVARASRPMRSAGEELPDPPPSLALVLGSTQSLSQNRNSKIAELVIDAGEMMVTRIEDGADRGERVKRDRVLCAAACVPWLCCGSRLRPLRGLGDDQLHRFRQGQVRRRVAGPRRAACRWRRSSIRFSPPSSR